MSFKDAPGVIGLYIATITNLATTGYCVCNKSLLFKRQHFQLPAFFKYFHFYFFNDVIIRQYCYRRFSWLLQKTS
jgi:hypothetical protein